MVMDRLWSPTASARWLGHEHLPLADGDKKRPKAIIRLAVPRGSVLSLHRSDVPDLEQVH